MKCLGSGFYGFLRLLDDKFIKKVLSGVLGQTTEPGKYVNSVKRRASRKVQLYSAHAFALSPVQLLDLAHFFCSFFLL